MADEQKVSDGAVVVLIDPWLCMGCRFAGSARIRLKDGGTETVMRCRRRDCDNFLGIHEMFKPYEPKD